MKYDLKKIMLNAWKNYRRYSISFAEALHRAWLSAKAEEINAERIKRSKEAADVTEDTNTWVGWKKLGYEVIHGSKALFGCSLIWGSKGDGASYNATGKGVDDAWNMLKNREGIWQGANIVQTYMSSFEKNIADVIELIDTEDITGYIPAEKTDRA